MHWSGRRKANRTQIKKRKPNGKYSSFLRCLRHSKRKKREAPADKTQQHAVILPRLISWSNKGSDSNSNSNAVSICVPIRWTVSTAVPSVTTVTDYIITRFLYSSLNYSSISEIRTRLRSSLVKSKFTNTALTIINADTVSRHNLPLSSVPSRSCTVYFHRTCSSVPQHLFPFPSPSSPKRMCTFH